MDSGRTQRVGPSTHLPPPLMASLQACVCAVDWGEGLLEVLRLGPLWALMVEVLGSPSPCARTSGWGLQVGHG